MNENIVNSIKALPPLPETTVEIYRLCSVEDTSLVEVVEAVKKDPSAVATLLKFANSAIYGARNVKIVDRAVGMFGKAVTKSFLVNDSVMKSFTIDLSPYGMSTEDFSDVAQKRNKLVTSWYSSIDRSMLDILATTAQVGNVGQIVLAKELKDSGKDLEFQDAIEDDDVYELEDEIIGHSTVEVSAAILDHWKLDPLISNSIKYSQNRELISQAPEDVKPYAIANFIIFHALDNTGKSSEGAMDDVYDLLHEYNLNEDEFIELLAEVKSES
jgi:HD-like signal output (HDOD) protein